MKLQEQDEVEVSEDQGAVKAVTWHTTESSEQKLELKAFFFKTCFALCFLLLFVFVLGELIQGYRV